MTPKKIRVRKLWEGKAAFRDKYIAECAGKRDITIVLKETNEQMTIPKDAIKARIHSYSEEVFRDFYGKTPHRLVYYEWKKDEPLQSDLFKI